jgi:competence protein ComGC
MKGGRGTSGFTIVETLIVLAVTGFLLFVAIAAVQGRTSHTEFTQAINEVQSQVQEVVDNASDGYYINNNDINCTAAGTTITLKNSNPNAEGTNVGCTLLGNALQFFSASGTYNTYAIVGLQCAGGTSPVSSNGLCASPTTFGESSSTDAYPQVLAPGLTNWPSLNADDYTTTPLENSIIAGDMYYDDDTANSIALVAFLANPAGLGVNPVTGTQTGSESNLGIYIATDGPPFGNTSSQKMVDDIDGTLVIPGGFTQVRSVSICFNSGTTNQYGTVDIGSKDYQGSTGLANNVQTTVSNGSCP